ncbi:MAG: glycosyltransferase family 2 protein [Ferruginibacter sp.]
MTSTPKVSVIIPTFNRASLLVKAIESVKAQDYKNWECLVVDDCSTDGTWQMLQELAISDNRILIYKMQGQQQGAPACRNYGLKKCTGNLVIFLDSDDLLANFCISVRVKYFLENEASDFLVFPILIFNETTHDLNLLWNIATEESDLIRFLKTDAVWQTSSVIYKKNVLLQNEGFRENLKFWQDFDLHLRLLLNGANYKKFLNLQPDCYHRNHESRISARVNINNERGILFQKLEFYLWQMSFMKEHRVTLTDKEQLTFWSAFMYFASLCLSLLKSKKDYLQFVLRGRKYFPGIKLKYFITIIYHLVIYFEDNFNLRSKLGRLYYKAFKRQLADMDVFAGNLIAKVKLST